DFEVAESLAEVKRDRVRADEHLVGDLLVGQSRGDEARHAAFGLRQALPARLRPLRGVPVPAPDAKSAEFAPDTGRVSLGPAGRVRVHGQVQPAHSALT